MGLKTAFLQGEAFDESRDVICQIPSELGYPPYMAARLKKPGYGLNDAPRKWWNAVDKSLTSYGLVPTRADRCTYTLYGSQQTKARTSGIKENRNRMSDGLATLDAALEYLMDPIARNNANGREVQGFVCLHVDDLGLPIREQHPVLRRALLGVGVVHPVHTHVQ